MRHWISSNGVVPHMAASVSGAGVKFSADIGWTGDRVSPGMSVWVETFICSTGTIGSPVRRSRTQMLPILVGIRIAGTASPLCGRVSSTGWDGLSRSHRS